ncbi:hypothetical protein GOODEAATRI_019323 [Goodea atripinnis]|uniref:Secreted protein n=1 Tax=Goodea atripinnis TaxID=208336 RepID=A0ABV0NVY8_9TELE
MLALPRGFGGGWACWSCAFLCVAYSGCTRLAGLLLFLEWGRTLGRFFFSPWEKILPPSPSLRPLHHTTIHVGPWGVDASLQCRRGFPSLQFHDSLCPSFIVQLRH